MSDEVSVEATGETVGEAKWAAVRELERLVPGVARDAIRFQVVTEGERGLLGVGYMPARVVATATALPAAPAAAAGDLPEPDSDAVDADEAALVSAFLARTMHALGVDATVATTETDAELTATLEGDDLGIAIGRHGQMIDALQYLANAIAHRTFGDDRRRVVIDAAGYRARRAETLEDTARRTAERAAATGHRIALDPMSAIERRIVHEALKDDPMVETASEGDEPNRYVVVVPRLVGD